MAPDISFELRLLEPRDRASAKDLLSALTVGIGGVATDAVRDAFVTDSAFVVAVALVDGKVAGIALIETTRRWIFRHLFVAFQLVTRRIADLLLRSIKHKAQVSSPPVPSQTSEDYFIENEAAPVNWSDDLPRTIFIGVAREFRGKGIADQLYRLVFAHLASRGIPRLIARIASDNYPSLKLHRRTGWRLYSEGATVLADKDLSSV